ncbi:NAD-dependent epimerase/dehydratase family protein, partial [Planctomycetota bacterium]
MSRYFVTGGSGFIGTNLVDKLLENGEMVLSIDKDKPRNIKHHKVYRELNILDQRHLQEALLEYQPEYVIHLAARTDLHGKSIKDYATNTIGVKNLLSGLSKVKCLKRCIFTSSKLVCKTGYAPKHDQDYMPNTYYGESKVIGEEIVRSENPQDYDWCIGRPTSIW